jgi:hypothetical protein
LEKGIRQKMKTCARCREPLEEDSPADLREMREELEKDFPGFIPEECAIICNDCHQKFQAWKKNLNKKGDKLNEGYLQ